MRNFLVLMIITIGLAGVFDAIAYKGRYRDEVWQDFKSQGRDFSSEIQRWLDKALSRR